MRLIELRQNDQHPSPLVVMAMADSEVCYHYRASCKKSSSEKAEGLDIIFASSQVAGGEQANGITVEDLLAICEDRAQRQGAGSPALHLVALKLQAARRALATDEIDANHDRVDKGSNSKKSTVANATVAG